MKRIIPILFLALASSFGFGQQDPQFSQYMFNPLIVNPAYAGSREALSFVALGREQWAGFDGAPSTQTLSIHAPLRNIPVSLGLSLLADKAGPAKNYGILTSYTYRVKMGKGKLAFALRAGIYNYIFDWREIDYRDANELLAEQEVTNRWIPSFDFGMRYNTSTFYTGFAISHINRPVFGFDNFNDTIQSNAFLAGHMIFTMGKAFEINDTWVVKPALLAKASEGFEWSADASVRIVYDKTISAGVSYRYNYGMVAMLEYFINSKFRAGYSYDINLNQLAGHHNGSHEIFIGYDIDLYKRKVLSPRHF